MIHSQRTCWIDGKTDCMKFQQEDVPASQGMCDGLGQKCKSYQGMTRRDSQVTF